MNPSTGDVRVHAGAADVFANVIDDQQVDVLDGKFGHEALGLAEQFGFASFHVLREQGRNTRRLMELVFHNAETSDDRRAFQNNPPDRAQHVLVTVPR